jgi:hypothetical protein
MTVPRPLSAPVLAAGLAMVLGACSGDAADPAGSGDAAASPAAASSAPAPPAGGTEPGAVLPLGDSGTLVWRAGGGVDGVVDLAVEAVRRQPARVLQGWVPADEVGDFVPYFVTASVTNAGDTDLGGAALPLYLHGAGGLLVPAASFGSDYARCPSTPLPEPFGPGERAEVCLVYTLAPGDEPEAVTFQPTSTDLAVAWQVG